MKIEKKLKFTFMIVKREISSKVVNFLKTKGIENYFSFYGKGSASSAILDYLGIGEVHNNIIIYPAGEEESVLLMESLKNSEYFKDIIAFRIPVKGISSITALNYLLKEDK